MKHTPETRQAQVMAYAETLEPREREDCLRGLAQGALWLTAEGETDPRFATFLDDRTDDDPAIRLREDMLSRYGEFETEIDTILQARGSVSYSTGHPAFIGAGETADVFSLHRNGEEYAVRVIEQDLTAIGFLTSDIVNSVVADDRIAATIAVKDEPGFEQVVAARLMPDRSITVAKRMSGKNLSQLTPSGFDAVTADQLEDLLNLAHTATEKGVVLTAAPDNIMYDPEAGFGLIDFFSKETYLKRYGQPKRDNIGSVLHALKRADARLASSSAPEEYRALINRAKSSMGMHKLLLSVIERQPADSEFREYTSYVEKTIADLIETQAFFEPFAGE